MLSKSRVLLILPCCFVLALGCSKANPNAPATVTGEVTYKGNKVPIGTVTFHMPNGGVAGSKGFADGTYVITDLAVGDYLVTIETDSAKPNRKVPVYGGKGASPASPGPAEFKRNPKNPKAGMAEKSGGGDWVEIPKKYSSKTRSGLKVTLTSGTNTANFDLTD